MNNNKQNNNGDRRINIDGDDDDTIIMAVYKCKFVGNRRTRVDDSTWKRLCANHYF